MNQVIIFDLDDTLYDEINFIKYGFKNVSKFLNANFKIDYIKSFNFMIQSFEKYGRIKIFDKTLEKFGFFSKKNLNKCISIYRYSKKNILLRSDAKNALKKFKKNNIYLITDGNKLVQKKKIDLLKIKKFFKKIYITHNYGIKNSKPSLFCFKKILKFEKCQWNNLIYIADDPNKDFVNLNKVGAYTIRITKGRYAKSICNKQFDAQYKISTLVNLEKTIKKILKDKNENK